MASEPDDERACAEITGKVMLAGLGREACIHPRLTASMFAGGKSSGQGP